MILDKLANHPEPSENGGNNAVRSFSPDGRDGARAHSVAVPYPHPVPGVSSEALETMPPTHPDPEQLQTREEKQEPPPPAPALGCPGPWFLGLASRLTCALVPSGADATDQAQR